MKTEELFIASSATLEKSFRPMVPYTPENTIIDGRLRRASTGNLRFNATIIEQSGADEITIYIDQSLAPYAVYTNEPWISPKWKGKKNPNENWFEKAAEKYASELARMIGGKLTLTDEDYK
jgi:hypothetical protein